MDTRRQVSATQLTNGEGPSSLHMEGGVDLRHDSKRQRGTTHPASAVHVDVDVDIGIGTGVGVGVVPTAKRAAEGSKAATAIVTAVDVGGYTTGKQSEAAVDCEGYTSTAAASASGAPGALACATYTPAARVTSAVAP